MPPTTFYALIPHLIEPQVLLIPEGDSWRLPVVQGEAHYSSSAQFLRCAFKAQLGLDLTVLRWVDYRYDAQSDSLTFFYAFENHSPAGILARGRWFTRDELEAIPLLLPDHRKVIHAWLDEAARLPVHPLRSPWALPGWFARARDWIAAQLAARGKQITGEIEQIKVWQRSCVLRIPTHQGVVFFKAVPQGFRGEVLLNEYLLKRFPQQAADFLAIDTTRCWMIAQDSGGRPLADLPDLALWQSVLRAYARMQIESIHHMDELAGIDLPRYPVASFPTLIDNLIVRGYSFQTGTPGALNDAEREKFFQVLPRIQRDCTSLAAFAIPSSLEHGDLNPWNILVAPGPEARRMTFIDWSDSLITHPFFSLAPLFGFLESVFGDPTPVQDALVRAYLAEWRDFGTPAALAEACAVANRLAWLNAALIMHQQVLPILEVPSEFTGTEALYLRFLLDRYAEPL